jgi:serine O-acetyltransferase
MDESKKAETRAHTRESAPEVSATVPDWSREQCAFFQWDPSRQLLRSLRVYQRAGQMRGPMGWLQRRFAALQHRFWSVISGAEIPLGCQIEGGLLIPHPNGIVIHPEARIGPNCLFFQQVTIGTGHTPGVPHIGGHVDVGAGAKILGGVRIGDHAQIGANAVVVEDVPEAATAVGIPGRVVHRIMPHNVQEPR